MAERNKQELHDDLTSYIRSEGQGGKTTAQDVRSFLSNVIDTFFSLLAKKQNTINGAASSILTQNLSSSKVLISDEVGKVGVSPVSSSELGHLAGLTAAIQPQLNSKQATITGGATSIISTNLTASRALVSDGSGKVSASAVTSTQLGYVSGVTSAIQTQLNGKATNADLLKAQRYLQAQFTLMGGGTVTYHTSGHIKWTQRFIAIPTDKASTSSAGFIDMVMPAVGTIIAGVGGAAGVTVTSEGIPLGSWKMLLAEHTPGGSNTAVVYKIMDYNTANANTLLPNHILVAVKSGDSDTPLKLGTGQVLGLGDSLVNGYLGNTTIKGGVAIQSWGQFLTKGNNTSVRVQTDNGYLDLGPQNNAWCHLQTDRGRFYFNQSIHIDGGGISSYGTSRISFQVDGVEKATLDSGANFTSYGNITAFSDARLKENIRPIESALQKVLKLEGVRYNRIDTEEKKEEIGVIAQQVKEVVPEVVLYNEEKDIHSVDYGRLTALLLEAIKEQQTEINNLKEKINHI